jgi:PAS domain S-box-containing protein
VWVTTADGTDASSELLSDLLEFETLFYDASTKFINLAPGELDREIEDVQRRVCEILDLDLAALWEGSLGDPTSLTLTHFHTSDTSLMQPVLGMRAGDYFPWLEQQMLAGRTVVASSLDELPKDADVDRLNLSLFGVRSNLTVPLAVGGQTPMGALGFNSTHGEREWPEPLVARLKLVAQIFAGALARRRDDAALRESEERLSLALDSAEAGTWSLDYGTGVFWLSARARRILGFAPEDFVSLDTLRTRVPADDWSLGLSAIDAAAKSGDLMSVEYRLVSPEGEVRFISNRGRFHYSESGEPEQLMGVTIDSSERKHAEESLRTSEARLEAAADLAGLAFYEVRFDEGTTYVDDRFRELTGLPPEREHGLGALEFWMEQIHPEDRDSVLDQRKLMHDGTLEMLFLEYRFLDPVHGERWLQHIGRIARRDAAGHAVRAYGVLRDITARRRAESELRELSRRLLTAQEHERAVLARELHDDVSQRLAVLAIDVGRAELAASDGTQAEAMQGVREGLMRLSEDVHTMAYQLHPSILEELGLAEALRAECERRHRRGGLDVSVDVRALPPGVPDQAALCLFRVAQEALTNATHHARARTVSVSLREADGGLLLAVSDDGCGFDVANPGKRGRLGLASMRERILLVNGTLDIDSAPGRGTTVVAWVPADVVEK